MEGKQFKFPVVIPVFERQSEGTFELESFVEAEVHVAQIREKLDQGAVTVLSYMNDWTRTALIEGAPCCLISDSEKKEVEALYYTGSKKFSNWTQCLSKMRLSNDTVRGSVVRVERNVFIRSYSTIISYELDVQQRSYDIHSLCSVPSEMHHCPYGAHDMYTLMCIVQGLREKQIKSMLRSFTVIVVSGDIQPRLTKYKMHPTLPGLVQIQAR
jgi:hypothetical protein